MEVLHRKEFNSHRVHSRQCIPLLHHFCGHCFLIMLLLRIKI